MGLKELQFASMWLVDSAHWRLCQCAGVVHTYSFDLALKKWRIDDAVGAIPVHDFCGFWGALAVALFDA